jgi:hypothetical protein
MAPAIDEQELVALETEFWESMRTKNVKTALDLTEDPSIITGAQGVSRIDHPAFEKLMTGATWELIDYEFTDLETRQITDDVAVVAYKVTEQLTVDGKPLTLEAFDSSTWVRRNGHWRCAVHTESPAGDPFGRDKKKAASR